ncbi:MAG TPA: hypothetical protein PKD85_05200 [Saprospiraceae bacterium]|nr:hypothetical protein [Saprospiraceae bacterium]
MSLFDLAIKKSLKKKDDDVLALKSDSFVVKTNIHFPTDYTLLYDSSRKALDCITKIMKRQQTKGFQLLTGWRKQKSWYKTLKIIARTIGTTSKKGGKNKTTDLEKVVQEYITLCSKLNNKLCESIYEVHHQADICIGIYVEELKKYMKYQMILMDQLERRIIKKEVIPNEEKIYSIFEPHTEWINKGKLYPNVELGKRLTITTDQYQMIIHHVIMEKQSDSQIVDKLNEEVSTKWKIQSWSFDKGYYSKENKELLKNEVPEVILPKKGKKNQVEKVEESQKRYKKLRNNHSAVESNINELEYRGLDKCPDKGYDNFKRYIALSVCAYNLHKIGAYMQEVQRVKIEGKKEKPKPKLKAA